MHVRRENVQTGFNEGLSSLQIAWNILIGRNGDYRLFGQHVIVTEASGFVRNQLENAVSRSWDRQNQELVNQILKKEKAREKVSYHPFKMCENFCTFIHEEGHALSRFFLCNLQSINLIYPGGGGTSIPIAERFAFKGMVGYRIEYPRSWKKTAIYFSGPFLECISIAGIQLIAKLFLTNLSSSVYSKIAGGAVDFISWHFVYCTLSLNVFNENPSCDFMEIKQINKIHYYILKYSMLLFPIAIAWLSVKNVLDIRDEIFQGGTCSAP